MTPGFLALRNPHHHGSPSLASLVEAELCLPPPSSKPVGAQPQGPAETASLPKAQGHFCPSLTTPTSHANKARHSPRTQAGIWVSHNRSVSTQTSMEASSC